MQAEFDTFADDYDRHLAKGLALAGETKEHFARARIEWTRGRLTQVRHPTESVLDFGCGTGTSTPMLRDLLGAREVLGVDVSQASLDRAPRGEGLSYALLDEVQPSGLDLAFTNGVFHHIEPADRPSSIEFIRDSLHDHGVLALWENSPYNPATRYGMWANEFDRHAIMAWPRTLRRLLESGGFRVLRTDFMFIFPHVLKSLRWVEPHVTSFPIGGQYVVLAQRR